MLSKVVIAVLAVSIIYYANCHYFLSAKDVSMSVPSVNNSKYKQY